MTPERTTLEQNDQIPPVSTKIPSLDEERVILKKYLPNQEWALNELEEGREGRKIFLIEFGSKSLLLYLEDENEFVTVVANNDRRKEDGDTTTVYRKAREIMQQEADSLEKKLHYEIATTDKKMVSWSKDKGEKIFHWLKIKEPSTQGEKWYFVTKIEPKPIE
jgi:hypothetical protein